MPGPDQENIRPPATVGAADMATSERLTRAIDEQRTIVNSLSHRPQQRQTRTVRFIKRKETPGTIVFQEQPDEGQPDVIGNLYVKKWWAGSATSIIVTVEKE